MIDCSAPSSPSATERVANTFDPPTTWSQLKRALLDLLMSANAIQEAATNLLSLRQRPSETVLEFNIRFRSAIARFESAGERAGPNRPPLVALYVSHYESVVKPSLQCLQYTGKPAVSLKEAMEKTRRHEAAGISGNISAIAFNHPDRTATHSVNRQTRYRSENRSKKPKWDRDARSNTRPKDTRSKVARPVCEHPTCRKRVGHTTENCFVRKREAGDTERRRRKSGPSRDRKAGKKHDSDAE